MTTFTITLSNASGFSIAGIVPYTLTTSGSSEDHHIHLIAGDPSITDIYLGDDDQYVKIEKNGGNVIIGTDTNTKQWKFGTNGSLTLPIGVSIDNNVDPLYPKIIADSGKLFSVQGQGNTGSAALAWTVDPNAAGQYAAVAVTRAGGGNLATVVLQAQSDSGNVGTVKLWRFDETGTLTLPQGSQISETTGVSTDITANGHTWAFDVNGNLTLPASGALIVSGGIVSSGASPAPSINGFNSANFAGNVTAGNILLTNGLIRSGSYTVVTDGINSIALGAGATMDVYGFPFTQPIRGQLTISGCTTTTQANGTWYYEGINTNSFRLYTDNTYTTLVDSTSWTPYTVQDGVVAITKSSTPINIVLDTNGFTTTFTNDGNLTLPTGGALTTTGNISGAYILGNGSQLTSLPAPTVAQDITSNGAMSIMLYDGNIKYNNYATVEPSTGNITGGNLITTGNVYASNVIINGQTLTATGAVNPDYINMTTSAAVNVAATGTDLTWDVNNGSSGIAYSAGKFSLSTGKTYHILAEIAMQNFSANGYLLVELVDGTTNARIGSQTLSIPYNTGFNEANNPTLDIVHTPVANQDVKLRVTGGSSGLTAQLRSSGFTRMSIVQINPIASLSAVSTISASGNISANNFTGNGGSLSNVATKTTGSWTLAPGVNTVSLSVPINGTYSIWVNGNIPNGIVTYTATAVVTNTNVPVLGSSYGWYYAAGNALVLTSIPTQFVGTVNNISNAVVSTTTANVFTFGITNNSGSSQIVNWGYTKL
jgi:hypothetical protein